MRLSVRRMMLLVAALGFVLAAYRSNVGLGIWVLSFESMVLGRAFMLIDRRRAAGMVLTLREEVRLLFGSFGVATVICGGAGAVFLGCLSVTVIPAWDPNPGCTGGQWEFTIPFGLGFSGWAAVRTASYLKYRPWPYDPDVPPRDVPHPVASTETGV